MDTERGRGTNLDPADFDLSVKVAWVKGLNRLYFYYEATDDYWAFKRPGLKNDLFELVVDADLSGGTFVKHDSGNENVLPLSELHFKGHGAHAQNYHIFTPAVDKSWAMIWGSNPWIKEFPHALAAQDFSFNHGEGGKLRMEFYITPYDHADHRGPAFSVVSPLTENDLIGLSWCIIEYDDETNTFEAFMNLAHDTRIIRNGSYLCAFKLMPVETSLLPTLKADWTFEVLRGNPRNIAFQDKSHGNITNWYWISVTKLTPARKILSTCTTRQANGWSP